MKSIMILGASGYLGDSIARRLQDENDYWVYYVYNSKGPKDTKEISQDKIECVKYNTDYFWEVLEEIEFDIIINCIGKYEQAHSSEMDLVNANFVVPASILERVSKTRNKQLTWINICTSLPKEMNMYSLSKWTLAEFGKYITNKYNVQFINVLLEMFYGGDEPENRFVKRNLIALSKNEEMNLTEGKQKRDIIYIDDVYDALKLIIDNKTKLKNYEDIPMGTGEAVSIREMLLYMKEEMKSRAKLNFGALAVRNNELDGAADITILKSLGFSPKVSWRQGIGKCIREL